MGGETPNGWDGGPSISGSELIAKSFICNILHLSHCESIFCGDTIHSFFRKLLIKNDLINNGVRYCRWQNGPKSIFRNILRTSPYVSRFCADLGVYKFCKLFKINILQEMANR